MSFLKRRILDEIRTWAKQADSDGNPVLLAERIMPLLEEARRNAFVEGCEWEAEVWRTNSCEDNESYYEAREKIMAKYK